jgi:metallo-beta-lactamase family protein
MSATLTFLGAAGTVTGSKHLLEMGTTRLLMDCGLFQGLKELRLRNWTPFPVPAASIQGVLLSHAHIDHSGFLPLLARGGFVGPVYCTSGTADLLEIMLPDSAHLQEEEAEFANRHRTSKHRPALPLYTAKDADRVLHQLRRVGFGETFEPTPGVSVRFLSSGHILGAALIEVRIDGRIVAFSGDLGRYDVPIMRDPDPVPEADTVMIESTYGNRLHSPDDRHDKLAGAVERALEQRGWLLIPAFAVGRTQEILYDLRELGESGRIPPLPVYLDSPMAIEATAIYSRHPEEDDRDLRNIKASGARLFVPKGLRICRSRDESKRLNEMDGPGIIIAGSGMATGGRILHHLMRRLPDPRTTVLFVGYQAAGTRGRLLTEGAREIRMLGQSVPVRAVIMLSDSYSAHADQGEILRWLGGFTRPPSMTYIIHGEPDAASALQALITSRLKWRAEIAQDGQRVSLG